MDYIDKKNVLLRRYQTNNFMLPDSLFSKRFKTNFTFNWVPNNLKSNFDSSIFWKFTKVNLILRMIHFTKDNMLNVSVRKMNDLIFYIIQIWFMLFNDIIVIEKGKYHLVSSNHKEVDFTELNKVVISRQTNIFYRKKYEDFWNLYNQIKTFKYKFIDKYLLKLSTILMKELNVNIKRIILDSSSYSLVLTTFLLITKYFTLWKESDKSFFKVWNLIPFLNFLCYQKFPKDKKIFNGNPRFLLYIPLFEKVPKDQIFCSADYLEEAMEDDLPNTNIKEEKPIKFVLKISLPERHIKKNSYNYVLNFYKKYEVVRDLLDSCIINSICGLYPIIENNNREIFRSLKDIKLLLRFYNNFVYNPNKVEFIKELCNNQVYLKCIIGQHVIFTIKDDECIPIDNTYWESNNNVSNKTSLTFSNFEECNKNNISNYRNYYFFKKKIKKVYETAKKKKQNNVKQLILNELKTSIENDLIINKLFDLPIEEYVNMIPSEVYDKFRYLVKYRNIPYHKKLSYCGLDPNDCKILKKIETMNININTKFKQEIKDLTTYGKFLCFNFFNYLTKFEKIKFYELSFHERLHQILLSKLVVNHFKPLIYTLCCKYPRICNKSGNQNAIKQESGLNEVSVGINGELYCTEHNKIKQKKNNELILHLLKKDIIQEIKKLFKYTKNRRQTFHLYYYIITGKTELPTWFDSEYDDELCDPIVIEKLKREEKYYKNLEHDVIMKEKSEDIEMKERFALVNFTEFTNAKKEHYKEISIDTKYLEPKTFSFPITKSRKVIIDILIKNFVTHKLQLKAIFKKRLRNTIDEVVTDTKTVKRSLVGQFVEVETKNRSKKKNKEKKKKKKNNLFIRKFKLCNWCGEPKLINNDCKYIDNYMCKDCSGEKEEEPQNKKKKTMFITLHNNIPLEII